MSTHVIKTTGALKSRLDLLVATFFHSCNIPFSVVEHPSFKALMEALCPGYQVPTRKQLSGNLLDDVTAEQTDSMRHCLNGRIVTLAQDGWSNIHNDPVLATCVTTDSGTYFLDATDTGSMPKTDDNCKELCQASIAKAQTDYGCTVRNIVTDNAKSMEKMREALQKDDPQLNVNVIDTKSSPYPSAFFTATGTNPTMWWRGLHWVKLPEGFVETVANLQSAKASSASIGSMGMAFSWRGCCLPTMPPVGRRSPLLRARGCVILRGNRGGSVGSTFDSGPMCYRFESHPRN